MRMENYASLDPQRNVHRKGLVNMNRLCRKVFNDWQDKQSALKDCAEVFTRDNRAANIPTLFDPNPIRVPKAFGKYELMDPIGDGGSGLVFSCVSSDDQNAYALKIIRTDRRYDHECFHRFRREIHALKAIRHPNIIRIHEDNLNDQESFPAFVMDLAETSLTELTKQIPGDAGPGRPALKRNEALSIYRHMLEAVNALHTAQTKMIHRDINPNNLLRMPDGRWVLADFGLAKFLSTGPVSTAFTTAGNQAWGTPFYTSPEQYRDFRMTDERTDVYSLGMLLWELFSSEWPPPRRDKVGLPKGLQDVFLKATEHDRTKRHRSVVELAHDIESALAVSEGKGDL